MRTRNRGFTLIELITVIAVVSLLTTIVVTYVQDARQRGWVAAGIKFDTSASHALGIDSYGQWDFEEIGGQIVKDSSSNGMDGTLQGGAKTEDFSYKKGFRSLKLTNDGDYVELPCSGTSPLLVPEDKITISAWFNMSGSEYWNMPLSFSGKGDWFALVIGQSSPTRIDLWNGWDSQTYFRVLYNFRTGQWHHVAVSFDDRGDIDPGEIRVFFDGQEIANSNFPKSNITMNGGILNSEIKPSSFTKECRIGTNDVTTNNFDGYVDDVRIYSSTLNSTQIEQYYAESSPKYQIANILFGEDSILKAFAKGLE